MMHKRISIAMAIAMLAAAFSVPASAAVYVGFGPPRPVVEHVYRAPGPGYVWAGGYYRRGGASYVWTPGRWVYPPRPAAAWVAPRWDYVPARRSYVFVGGYWRWR